ncbi:BMC domain-containing protein [Lachnospiraceae bacterium 47-T17]
MAQACGIIEVFGLVTAFEAADAGCKAANVTLEPFDRNKPANADALPVPLIICVKFRGTVMDVTAAVDAAQEVAERTTGMVSRYIISGPDEGTQMMFGLNAFDKN